MLRAVKDLYVLTCYWNFHKLQNNQQTFLKMFCALVIIMYIPRSSAYAYNIQFSSLVVLFLYCVLCASYFAIQDRYHYSQIREMQKFSMISTFALQWDVITQHFKQTLLNIIDLALIYIYALCALHCDCNEAICYIGWSMCMHWICKSNIILC